MSASVAGVRRRYLGAQLNGSLRKDMMAGQASLLQRTRQLATHEVSFADSECTFGWQAAFTQVWSYIQIRIRLDFDSNVSAADRAALPIRWKQGIENVWNNKGGVAGHDESFCPFQFEVQFVTSGEHHQVRVVQGSGHTNMGVWHTVDSGNTAAHEFGHMMGNNDEYTDAACPNRSPVNTGTVMDNDSNNVPLRMLQPLADQLGSTAVPKP
jgi:hypothetical protein